MIEEEEDEEQQEDEQCQGDVGPNLWIVSVEGRAAEKGVDVTSGLGTVHPSEESDRRWLWFTFTGSIVIQRCRIVHHLEGETTEAEVATQNHMLGLIPSVAPARDERLESLLRRTRSIARLRPVLTSASVPAYCVIGGPIRFQLAACALRSWCQKEMRSLTGLVRERRRAASKE